MKAARIAAPRKWEFVDVDVPSPNDGEVLLKMEYYSVCCLKSSTRCASAGPATNWSAS
jgi:NADPH:quinone reductase-like Zn-dependent oxidoreductase